MSGTTGTIVAALIGAIVGSLGAQIIADRLIRMRERRQTARDLIRLHLIQLEDATESLLRRLENVRSQGGRAVMGDEYYLASMLYALGSFLAHKRIFLLEGHYAVLDDLQHPQGTELQRHLEDVETRLDPHSSGPLFRYDRLALAESVMRWDDGGVRICSSLEFRNAYGKARRRIRNAQATQQALSVRGALIPAENFMRNQLQGREIDDFLAELKALKDHLRNVRERLQRRDLTGILRRTRGPQGTVDAAAIDSVSPKRATPEADLEVFRTVVEHFRHNLTMFWQHSLFFIAIQGALLTVFTTVFTSKEFSSRDRSILLALGIFGLLLSLFWCG